MKLQVVLPNESADTDPGQLVTLARHAEEIGYDTAWLPDHILPPGDYGPVYGGVYEPLVLIGHLTALTSRIRFGTSVLVLPLRNPFVVAKQVATAQELSGGRVVLGVGIGWDEQEFASVGADYRHRASRTDEAIALLRHLFTIGSGPFPGRFYGFETGVFAPRPSRPVPIMVGGVSDAALRRVARYADIWQGVNLDPDTFREKVSVLRQHQPDRDIAVGTRISWSGLDETVARVEAFRASGAQHLAVHFGELEGYVDRMAALMRVVNTIEGHRPR